MSRRNLASAEGYYTALGNKDLEAMEKYLHPKVQFIGPLSEMTGKESLLEAAKSLFYGFDSLVIRAKFSAGEQVMLAYDLACPPPIGIFRVASLLTFKDDLIGCIELFYDARPFEKMKK